MSIFDDMFEDTKKKKTKDSKPKRQCLYCGNYYTNIERHLPYCSENPDNKKKEELDYEKFVRRNIDMLKEALDESIKQYRNKKDDKSQRRVKRYNKIYEKLLHIERELDE